MKTGFSRVVLFLIWALFMPKLIRPSLNHYQNKLPVLLLLSNLTKSIAQKMGTARKWECDKVYGQTIIETAEIDSPAKLWRLSEPVF